MRRPPERPGELWRDGDAWLAGGTWLFSEQQPRVRRLVDLVPLGWQAIEATDAGLSIGATCSIRDLYELEAPADWRAGPLLKTSCEAFLASFKVWNSATVGGNICMSLPAGPMITMSVALEARYTLWARDGSERTVAAADFVTGNHENILGSGEVLRRIDIPLRALRKRHAHRRFTLTQMGRSTIFMIATQSPDTADLRLTITAATTHPIVLAFDSIPEPDALQHRIDALPDQVWFDDANGAPDHRRHLAKHYAEEIRTELAAGAWRSPTTSTETASTNSHAPASACGPSCVLSDITVSKRVATQAIAGRALSGSMAPLYTAASHQRSGRRVTRSPQSKASAHRMTFTRCNDSFAMPPAFNAASAPRA